MSLPRAARAWAIAAFATVALSAWSSGVGREEVVNQGGWQSFAGFWSAALHPDRSPEVLRSTASHAVTTVSLAVVGTVLAVVVGLVAGALTSETWSKRTPGGARRARRRGWAAGRFVLALPRGAHEVVWGLLLVNVLGRDPAVGVLAIAIPGAAMTAKVYAEVLDESTGAAYEAIRQSGAGRVAALAYGVVPTALPDLASYAFYRFECSVRAAVMLGMVGAGGLGFEFAVSTQALDYPRMWTVLYVLIVVSMASEAWGRRLRDGGVRRPRWSGAAATLLVVVSFARVAPDLGRLAGGRSRRLLIELAQAAWPPSLPVEGWSGLLRASVETVEIATWAIALAAAPAVALAFTAAAPTSSTRRRRAAAMAVRLVLHLVRAVPPPVWAVLVLFAVFPGRVAAVLALAVFNVGVLGRMGAEVVGNLDSRNHHALQLVGAPRLSAFAYATMPVAANRFVVLAVYRWEVAMRESVVVGVVAAGGLGRVLEEQRAALDYQGMFGTVAALVALSLSADLFAAALRRRVRGDMS